MITVISGTDRRESESLNFAKKYVAVIQAQTDEPVRLLALEEVPHDWWHVDMYETDGQKPSIAQLQDTYMLPAQKFIFISPEYNGSFPGVLKLFLDACSVREYKATFKGKKAALVGIATGRAGNLRGMDHLTGILNHLGIIVLPNKVPISKIDQLYGESGDIADAVTLRLIERHVEEFLAF